MDNEEEEERNCMDMFRNEPHPSYSWFHLTMFVVCFILIALGLFATLSFVNLDTDGVFLTIGVFAFMELGITIGLIYITVNICRTYIRGGEHLPG